MKKMVRYATILILFLCSWSLVPLGSCDFHPGYTVEPVTPDMDPGTPLETVPVDFWDLPPGMILLALALSVSSFIGFPVELFIFIKLYAFLGYRRISQVTILSNQARSRIYTRIQDNPGITYNALVQMAEVKRGTLRYHLILLKLGGKITAHEASGSIHYFTNSGLYSDSDKTVITYLRNTTDRRIFQLLMENSEVTRKEIGNDLGLSVSTVSWRMKRLSDDKIIWIRKTGKNVRYGICPDVRQYLEKHLMPNRETVQITPMEQIRESA
jgi:predicted transcriptional regulator